MKFRAVDLGSLLMLFRISKLKRYELMIEPIKGIIMRLNKYQEDVENEGVPWGLERVEAVAAEILP